MLTLSFLLLVTTSGLVSAERPPAEVRLPTDYELKLGEEAGYSYVDRLAQLEEDLYAQGVYVKEGCPMARMSKFKQPNKEAIKLGQQSMQLIEATRFLKNQLGLTNEEVANLGKITAASRAAINLVNNTCPVPPTCKASAKYRNIDGSCNSLTVTNLGQSSTVYRRLVSPSYDDGIQAPRSKSVTGANLMGTRPISTRVFALQFRPLPTIMFSFMQMGQFLTHDIANTPQFTFSNGTPIACCSGKKSLPANQLNPYCLPVDVPLDDRFFNPPAPKPPVQNCMNFVRSVTGPRIDCTKALGYADQLNSNTHWLDGSAVYGSNEATLQSLRNNDGKGYLLKMLTDSKGRSLLPTKDVPNPECNTAPCFYAGDARVTEQPQLTVMHTLWAREHNRVAASLKSINPSWPDESVFQEARRIVVAELQHIVFKEFLSILLDNTTYYGAGLAPETSGYTKSSYDNTMTSGPVSNEFVTAAFRMGHSIVEGAVRLFDEAGNSIGGYNLKDNFHDGSKVLNDPSFLDNAIRGLINQPIETVDYRITVDMWNQLFMNPGEKTGFDIIALNLQRGRDHGLAGYNTYRSFCGFQKVSNFEQLRNNSLVLPNQPMIRPQKVDDLIFAYQSVDDIDLFSGGTNEMTDHPEAGQTDADDSVVGPTYSCLIAENFQKLKMSDRFFYERGGQPGSFTASQLNEIKKASLARIYCDNSDGTVNNMQPNAFLAADSLLNPRVSCSDITKIPKIDLTQWKGEPLPA